MHGLKIISNENSVSSHLTSPNLVTKQCEWHFFTLILWFSCMKRDPGKMGGGKEDKNNFLGIVGRKGKNHGNQ